MLVATSSARVPNGRDQPRPEAVGWMPKLGYARRRDKICASLDDVIRTQAERRRECKVERLGRFEIDRQLERGRALHRQLGWIRASQDEIDVPGRAA